MTAILLPIASLGARIKVFENHDGIIYFDVISLAFCPNWLLSQVFPISPSRVAGIKSMYHHI
jgi:hypothetical protein